MSRYYVGTIFDTPERNKLRVVEDALIVVDECGVITAVLDRKVDGETYDKMLQEGEQSPHGVRRLAKGQYWMPGLVDLHVHAPQWPQLGKALDKPLEYWLQECTFPLEAKYSDVAFAQRSYSSLVSTLLACGTTTVAYFASIHLEASILLAKICVEKGQRAVVGRVAMDLPDQCPEYYRDPSPAESIARSEEFIQKVRQLPHNEAQLVLPAVIPRFIPSCSHEALEGLGKLVSKYDCHVQTHCSESDWEHHHVINRYHKHDAFALDDFGLLTRRTVLAHGNYISTEDFHLIKERGSAVAHCPLSNVYFSDAVFPFARRSTWASAWGWERISPVDRAPRSSRCAATPSPAPG
ncbi:guanine deaminase [Angomonas deanei]|nr:guanine deaminase [Angomonas deanei]|eukprot:EPY26354.1 guanine deaminase [Angomonas deanei]